MFQVAIYGKGGIGKSTISANISVALSEKGKKVMQIGCDPKHDSTRLLIGGRTQKTVLEYVRETHISRRKLDDVICTGTNGVLCAEAGGPEPGIGCAGRGILSTFDTLKKLGADDLDVDIRLYDVLGDVVCGGFAVPLRREYADTIILVTSGEFMSIYAANNIMKGIMNFSDSPRIAGIILNCRNVEDEKEKVERFSKATGVPIIATIARSKMFADAESKGHTIRELYPDSDLAVQFDNIAERLIFISEGKDDMYLPNYLDDDQMEALASGKEIPEKARGMRINRISCDTCRVDGDCKKNSSSAEHSVVYSCAAHGAVSASLCINDSGVVLHGPRSCSYIMASNSDRVNVDRAIPDYSPTPSLKLISTDINDGVSIFGGSDALRDGLLRSIEKGNKLVFVVTTCVAGIIGDDVDKVVEGVLSEHPDVCVKTIIADGNIVGDYFDGFILAIEKISELIDPDVTAEKGYVNLIGSTFFRLAESDNRRSLYEILDAFGLKVNCRFINECTVEDVKNYYRAEFNIMIAEDGTCGLMMDAVSEVTGRSIPSVVLPVGVANTEELIRQLGSITGRTEAVEPLIGSIKDRYHRGISKHVEALRGKRVIVFCSYYTDIDWFFDYLLDLGLDIIRIGYMTKNIYKDYEIGHRYRDPSIVRFSYEKDDLYKDIGEMAPDLVITSNYFTDAIDARWAFFPGVNIGVDHLIKYAGELANVLCLPKVPGWKKDVMSDDQ